MNLNTEQLDKIYGLITEYGLRILVGIIVLLIGFRIIKWLSRLITKGMQKKEMDDSLRSFLQSLISITLKVLLIISVMSMIGIEMTSFIALLGAAGLAVGLALSGTLQNFAGGVLILIIRPFKTGDYITAQGYSGTVSDIQIFNTILKTVDNKTIFLPNGPLSTSSIINFSTESTRRVDLEFGIGYADDIDKAKRILWDIVKRDERIFKEPEPLIAVKELANSSVNIAVRVWVNAGDYWPYYWDMHETVKKEFDKNGVSIPFPQTDVHLYKNE